MIESIDSKGPRPEGSAALRQAMADAVTMHPVEDLQSHGIRRIRVVSESRLETLVRLAVNRTLRQSLEGIDLPANVLEEIAERSRKEYERLLDEGLEKPPSPPPVPASTPVGLREFLRREEATLRDLVEERDGETPPLSYNISPLSDEFRALEDRMVRNLSDLLEKDWQAQLAEVHETQSKRLEFLERRIGKLVRALESTDRVLTQIQRGRQAGAPTGESGSSKSDGLDPSGPLFEKKSQLLQEIFRANLELRELEGGQSREG